MIGARVRPIPDQAVILDLNRMVRTFDWSVQIQTFQVYFEIVLFELFENSMETLREMMIAKLFFQKKKITKMVFLIEIIEIFRSFQSSLNITWSWVKCLKTT